MNMVVAEYAHINFNQYASWMVPIAVAGWLIAYPILRLIFARQLAKPTPSSSPSLAPAKLSTNQRTMIALLGVVFCLYPIMALVDGHAIWVVAVLGALGALLLASRDDEVELGDLLVKTVAWDIFVFLLCVYVIAIGLRNVGLTDLLAQFYAEAGIGRIGSTAAVGSAILNNHPMSLINLMALESIPNAGQREILAGLIGGDLGPRLLPIGSLAGLLWIAACKRFGVEVSLRRFMSVGLMVTIPTMAASLVLLYLR